MEKEPSVVGRYVLCGELASGGMATIYIGHPVGGTKPVAIKRLPQNYAADQDFVTMFLDETWLASRVHHMNVVETLDVVSADGELCLVMEYVEGETLSRVLRALRNGKVAMPLPIVGAIMTGVLEGLAGVHEARGVAGDVLGIIHRDVSPQNVLIGVDGVPRLLDFGVAKAAGRLHSTRTGQLKGKLSYMAPEQLEHDKVSQQSDIYAAGIVLWEALSGRRLYEAENEGALVRMILEGPKEPPSAQHIGLAREIDDVVMTALSREQRERFATARDMARAIERVMPCARSAEVGEWLKTIAQASLDARAKRVATLLSGGTPPDSEGLRRHPSSQSVPSLRSSTALRTRPPRSEPSISNGTKAGVGKSILVIDDSAVILDEMKRTLEGDGFKVTTTTQTVGAARHLVDCDLAIIDFHMPGLDGAEVIRSLRNAARGSGRTCLFYLYTADPAVAPRYAALGFDGAFTEKGDATALVRQVRGAFRVLQMRAMKK